MKYIFCHRLKMLCLTVNFEKVMRLVMVIRSIPRIKNVYKTQDEFDRI